jgi:membrane associated rhomboid family serine protease
VETHALCTLILIGATVWVSWLGFRDRVFEEKYLFWPEAILGWRQYYRVFTSGFLHLDWMHLGMNMFSLYLFGNVLEPALGPGPFLLIYFGSILGGSLLSLWVHRHHDYRALGASGGVSGLILAYVFLFPRGGIEMMFVLFAIPGWIYAIGYLTVSFYGMVRRVGNVGHDAHLGGSLAGMFIAAALQPDAIHRNLWLFAGVTVGSALLVLYLTKNSLFLPLSGFNFIGEKSRSAGTSRRFSPAKLFNAARIGIRPAPPGPTRADRRIDEILQKISEKGLHSLTDAEKNLLNTASELQRRRALRQKPKIGFPF